MIEERLKEIIDEDETIRQAMVDGYKVEVWEDANVFKFTGPDKNYLRKINKTL